MLISGIRDLRPLLRSQSKKFEPGVYGRGMTHDGHKIKYVSLQREIDSDRIPHPYLAVHHRSKPGFTDINAYAVRGPHPSCHQMMKCDGDAERRSRMPSNRLLCLSRSWSRTSIELHSASPFCEPASVSI